MKNIIIITIFILCLPLAHALYGGETQTYHFDVCDELRVNVTGTNNIDEGEYAILNDCAKNKTNYYVCNCDDDYDFSITFRTNTLNNYTLYFNYDYEEEQPSSSGSSSRRSTCVPKWNCTEWSECRVNNSAVRECYSLNNCYIKKPREETLCYYDVKPTETDSNETGKPQQTEQITEPPVTEKQEKVQEKPQQEEEQKKKLSLFWWIIIGLTLILAVVFISIYNREK